VKARIAEGFCSAARVPFVEFAVVIFSYFCKARSRVDEGGADAKLAAERAHLAGQFSKYQQIAYWYKRIGCYMIKNDIDI